MAESANAAVPLLADRDRLHWTLRRLHSLSGVVPIGFYLLFHILFENTYVLRGGDVWWKHSESLRQLPFQMAVEALLLWIPISYHAIYGIFITATAAPNSAGYGYTRNLQYTLQRITGILALAFIGFHVATTRGYFYVTGIDADYARMHSFMINPIFLSFYIIGTLSCVYHFTNGIFTFCITWGITQGPRAQMMVNYACIALFVILAFVSVDILVAFRAPT